MAFDQTDSIICSCRRFVKNTLQCGAIFACAISAGSSHTPALFVRQPRPLRRGCSEQISEPNRCKFELRFRLLRAKFDEFFHLLLSLVA